MSNNDKCLYHFIRDEMDAIRRDEAWLDARALDVENSKEALLTRCGWAKSQDGSSSKWSRGTMKRMTTNEALEVLAEALNLLTAPEESAPASPQRVCGNTGPFYDSTCERWETNTSNAKFIACGLPDKHDGPHEGGPTGGKFSW